MLAGWRVLGREFATEPERVFDGISTGFLEECKLRE